MYEAHWQLERDPFGSWEDEAFFYPAPTHQATLAKLLWLVEQHREACVVVGHPGVGKSQVIYRLSQHVSKDVTVLRPAVFPKIREEELLSSVAEEFGLHGEPRRSTDPGLYRAVRWLRQRLATSESPIVLILDDAHLLSEPSVFEGLLVLLNLRAESRTPLSVLLVGQPPLLSALSRSPALESRIAVHCLIRPLSGEETAAYIEHRLRAAGARRSIFEPDALAAIHELSGGVPRRINRLGDLALVLGYGEGCRSIRAEQIEAVAQELGNPLTPELT